MIIRSAYSHVANELERHKGNVNRIEVVVNKVMFGVIAKQLWKFPEFDLFWKTAVHDAKRPDS